MFYYKVAFLLVLISNPLQAVTVGPALCPTNKIAPHRRIYARDGVRGRTFGAFYDLLVPNSGPYDPENDLQEMPQVDDPDDCGDIEDYDENDLSSITPQTQRRRESRRDDRYFFRPPVSGPIRPPGSQPPRPPNGQPSRPPNGSRPPFIQPERPPFGPPERPPYGPPRPPFGLPPYVPPNRPPFGPGTKPPLTRPPYWSGGFFGSNEYRPPIQQNPSDFVKPIHEYSEFNQGTYRPDLVGAPLGHIVGVTPIRPTTSEDQLTTSVPLKPNRPRYTTLAPDPAQTRRSRPRNINNGVFGSFVDLLFK